MRTWLIVFALVGCEKSKPAPEPGPAPESRDAELTALATDMIAYTRKMPKILEDFSGDCAAHAEHLMVLEPLASSIRARAASLSPEENKGVRARIAARKDEILREIDAELAQKHLTRADIEAKDAAVNTACGNDPKVKAAMERVGMFKKTPAPN